MPRPDLSKLPPEDLSALQAREEAIDNESNPPIDLSSLEVIRNLSAQLEASKREAEAAKSQVAALESRVKATTQLLTRAEREARCVPTVIGGSDGISPSESFDIRLAPSPFNTNETVAWIPVVLWPIPVAETRNGRTFNNVGKTSVRESLSIYTVTDAKGRLRHFALTGYASLSVIAELSADEVADRIAQRDSLGLLSQLTDDDHNETSQPPFIPSEHSQRASNADRSGGWASDLPPNSL